MLSVRSLRSTAFIFRTPLSSRENWTYAISWNSCRNVIVGAVLHGLARDEMSSLQEALNDVQTKSYHPLSIPMLLCQMLSDSDANAIKTHAAALYKVEFRTNFDGHQHATNQVRHSFSAENINNDLPLKMLVRSSTN